MITSATRPFLPHLVFVRSVGTRPRIGEIVTPGVYFLYFFLLFDVLLICTDRIVRRWNVVNGW